MQKNIETEVYGRTWIQSYYSRINIFIYNTTEHYKTFFINVVNKILNKLQFFKYIL